MTALTIPTAAGLAEPALASQRVFRQALEAMARPGTVVGTEIVLAPPAPLSRAAGALILTLADFETLVWFDRAAQSAADYVRFHTGAPLAAQTADAAFAIVADSTNLPPLTAFALGTDEYPDRSTSLIVEVESIAGTGPLMLSGPGILGRRPLGVHGLAPDFWHQWRTNHRAFPRGVDVFLTAGARFVALPRTTTVET